MHKCSLLTVAARGRLQALMLCLLFHHGMKMRRIIKLGPSGGQERAFSICILDRQSLLSFLLHSLAIF